MKNVNLFIIETEMMQVYSIIFPDLSLLELDCIKYIDEGFTSYDDLCGLLGISINTLKPRLSSIYSKVFELNSAPRKMKMIFLKKILTYRKESYLCVNLLNSEKIF